MAHPTPATSHAEAPHVEHITSWAPLVLVTSMPFLLLALLAHKWATGIFVTLLLLGAVFLFWGIFWWMLEDMRRFRRNIPQHYPGQPGALLGMKLFIGTEVLIFASIFAIWFVGEANRPDLWHLAHLPVVATGVNTVILVASSGTLMWGSAGLKKGNYNRYLIGLGLTILLGAIFLVNQVLEYIELAAEGMTLSSKTYGVFGSSFYMLTGTHGLHVAGGLFVLMLVFFRSLKRTQSADRHTFLHTADIYWHFVDVVWIFLFIVVYLRWI